MRPGCLPVSLIRPVESTLAACHCSVPIALPRVSITVDAMALKLAARTVAVTICPGNTGIAGVVSICTSGVYAVLSATTFNVML